MAMRDILLQIDTYPEATSNDALDQAIRFAVAIDGLLSALAVEVEIQAPRNRLADYLIGLAHIAAEEERKSRRLCAAALELFNTRAEAAGVPGQAIHGPAGFYRVRAY